MAWCYPSLPQQKMDKNKDGVVTIDEFIDCCQNVSGPPAFVSSRHFGTLVMSELLCFCFVARTKTSCAPCTSLKTSFNFTALRSGRQSACRTRRPPFMTCVLPGWEHSGNVYVDRVAIVFLPGDVTVTLTFPFIHIPPCYCISRVFLNGWCIVFECI